MSLYLSDWLDGPFYAAEALENAWDPMLVCSFSEQNKFAVNTYITLFDREILLDFIEGQDPDVMERFVVRLDAATSIILKVLQVKKFVEVNFRPAFEAAGKDLVKASESLSVLLDQFILDYEFWSRRNLIDLYINLIFYGMPDNPCPLFFVLPPLSSWDDID